MKTALSANRLILLTALFITAFGNLAFFSRVLQVYPFEGGRIPALLSIPVIFGGATVLMLAPFCFRRTVKPILAALLLLSALAAYFMDNYGAIISADMLRNVAHTNTAEAAELLTFKLLGYVVLLGILPAVLLLKTPLAWRGWKMELLSRMKLFVTVLVVVSGTVMAFGDFYASFFRQHKALRAYANPGYYLYSAIKYGGGFFGRPADAPLTVVGQDVRIPRSDIERELVILVVGETARADRFSLNGYARETTPQLKQRGVVSFTNFWACGTSTAVSVPCMFLLDGKPRSSETDIKTRENLLDVLRRSGVNVLWLDNNSDSKGVAARAEYRNFKSSAQNPVCDSECRDEGMLPAIQPFIDSHPQGDILIVLHQMGNHGPAYYRRYPPAFEKFTPVCRDSDLSRCTREEIGNAYDNAILYTDDFLAKTIDVLKRNDERFETILFYVSDHGESLGENGLYLHGLPTALAPDAQLHIPALMWFGENFHDADVSALRKKTAQRFTHANVFHTVIGMLEAETTVYQPALDMLDGTRDGKRGASEAR